MKEVQEEVTQPVDTDPMLPDTSHQDAPPDGDTTRSRHSLGGDTAMISIQRSAYTQDTLSSRFGLERPEPASLGAKLKSCCVSTCCTCSAECAKKKTLSFLPFIETLRTYQWKKWIVLDIMAGLSVGVIHIPQGMGFALLTSLPPVYGLYSSFFPVLIYFFFGTSRHISVGTMALISLMMGAIIDREVENLGLVPPDGDTTGASSSGNETSLEWNSTASTTSGVPPNDVNIDDVKVGIAVSISLIVGCLQLLMGILRLGVIATFMSMPFVQSFLTGAAVHIITSQVPSLFGVKLPPHSGLFKVPLTYYELFRHITLTNVASLLIGLICMVVLIILKEIINIRYRKYLKVPIPAELIVLVLATIISHFAGFHDLFGVKVIGAIPRGIPAPRLPPMTNASNYVVEAIPIAILSFTVSITMAKLMARKHRYPIDVNQEMLAYGLMNGISAFFNSFAGCQAPPRSLVQDSVGGKTQLSSLISCILVLLVCLALGPLFFNLPNSVLAAIIICALLPLFKQFQELPVLWRVNKYDLFVWILTFLCVVILDITSGLGIGIGLSVIFVVIQGHLARGVSLLKVADTELYVPQNMCQGQSDVKGDGDNTNKASMNGSKVKVADAGCVPGVKVFRFAGSLYFANVEAFKQQLFASTVNPMNVNADAGRVIEVKVSPDVTNGMTNNKEREAEQDAQEKKDEEVSIKNGIHSSVSMDGKDQESQIQAVILDCSSINYIDIMGLHLLKALRSDFGDVNIRFLLADCDSGLLNKMDALGITDKFDIFPSVYDAVAMATSEATSSWV